MKPNEKTLDIQFFTMKIGWIYFFKNIVFFPWLHNQKKNLRFRAINWKSRVESRVVLDFLGGKTREICKEVYNLSLLVVEKKKIFQFKFFIISYWKVVLEASEMIYLEIKNPWTPGLGICQELFQEIKEIQEKNEFSKNIPPRFEFL